MLTFQKCVYSLDPKIYVSQILGVIRNYLTAT